MTTITTTLGDMDESLLQKHEGGFENDNEQTVTTEYCIVGCRGVAHILNRPDSDSYFCNQHVHRSVSIKLKQSPFVEGIIGSLR